MNAALAAAGAAFLTCALWRVAQVAALRRGFVPGALPWALVAASATAAALRPEPRAVAVLALVSAAGAIDARTGCIPDPLVLVGAACVAAAAAPRDLLSGALLGIAVPGTLYLVTAGRGIGLGDVKLCAALGIGLGGRDALIAVLGAFACGACYASALLAVRRARRSDAVAFAPFLGAGAYGVILTAIAP